MSTRHLGLAEQGQQAREVEPSRAAADVMARQRLAMRLGRACGRQGLRRRREIAVGEILEQLLAKRMHRGILAGAVHRHEQPDILVEEQVKVGVHEDRVAAVTDDVQAVAILVVEAERHARKRRISIPLPPVHQLRRGRIEERAAVGELGDHELAHVRAGRGQRTGRSHRDHFIWLGLVRRILVGLRHQWREVRRQRLLERRMRHSQRIEDVVLDVAVELLARDSLDDVAGQRRAVVRVGRHRSRRVDAVRDRARQHLAERVGLGVVLDQIFGGLRETRRVGHQVAHRDRLAVQRRNLEVEVGVDVGVEVDLARLHLLHDRGPGEQLGDRAGPEQRQVGIDRLGRLEVGIAEAAHRSAAGRP